MDTNPCNEDCTMSMFDAGEGPNVFASYDVGKSQFEVRAQCVATVYSLRSYSKRVTG